MLVQSQSLRPLSLTPSIAPISISKPFIISFTNIPFRRTRFEAPKCSLSAVTEPTHAEPKTRNRKLFPAEVSRTIMELGSVGTLSTVTQEGWPIGIGVRFAVDSEGTPVVCLNSSDTHLALDGKSSLHVQLEQCGLRTPQCTILGSIYKPEDGNIVKNLNSTWKKRFGEEVDKSLIYSITVERVLQIEDFKEVSSWVSSSDYKSAQPDPLRNIAQKLVNEINTNHVEDINRFCNIYVDLNFQISEAKVIWMDRLGFDMRLWSPLSGIFEVRIPFPAEVTDEKGAKSAFNCMSQLAWEVEKNFNAPDFEKVRELKQIT